MKLKTIVILTVLALDVYLVITKIQQDRVEKEWYSRMTDLTNHQIRRCDEALRKENVNE